MSFKERLDASHAVVTAAVETRIATLQQAGQKGLAAACVRTQLTHIQSLRLVNVLVSREGSLLHHQAACCCVTSLLRQDAAAAGHAVPVPERLHFNEDLAMRATWLPPAGCSPRFATPHWWGAQCPDAPVREGLAHLWWLRPHAAEQGGPEGACWRAGAEAALRRRALLPALLAGALAAKADEAVSNLQGAARMQVLAVLVAAAGCIGP